MRLYIGRERYPKARKDGWDGETGSLLKDTLPYPLTYYQNIYFCQVLLSVSFIILMEVHLCLVRSSFYSYNFLVLPILLERS